MFAKTDIIHHQQQGVPVPDILLGLAHAVVRNYRGSVMRKLPLRLPILFAGGVSRIQVIIEAFRTVLDLAPGEVLLHEHAPMASAIGAAGGKRAVFVPQNEGAEVDGQYSRFLRAKLDAEGFGDVAVASPYLEDLAEATD